MDSKCLLPNTSRCRYNFCTRSDKRQYKIRLNSYYQEDFGAHFLTESEIQQLDVNQEYLTQVDVIALKV